MSTRTTLPDPADIVREGIGHSMAGDSAWHALDALVAERDEERRRAIENGRLAQANWDRAEAAQARVAELEAELGEFAPFREKIKAARAALDARGDTYNPSWQRHHDGTDA